VVIGAKGVERIIEIEMSASEKKEFNASVESVRGLVNVVKKMSAAAAKSPKKAPKKAAKKTSAKK
jgi:malate dehydrogenase